MRINKFLANSGLGSRRKVEELILNGNISINGITMKDLSYDVKDSDIVKFNNSIVKIDNEKVYLMLNKPKCYITSTKDEKDRRIVMDLIRGCKHKVFPVGRLDFNTQGLLLLTNDGEWANNIIHPSKHIEKTYEVSLKYVPSNKQLNELRKGIIIDGRRTLPAKAKIVDKVDDYYILNITIYEGRNREIRKMFEYLGLKIYALKRVSIGGLELGDLKEGKFRYLTNEEKNNVFLGECDA